MTAVEKRASVVPVLEQLLQTLLGSLPAYLSHTHPWTRRETQRAHQVLRSIATDQESDAHCVAEALKDHGGRPGGPHFPAEYTALHDLNAEYLARHARTLHQRDLATIRRCAEQLDGHPQLEALSRRVLEDALAHERQLNELAGAA